MTQPVNFTPIQLEVVRYMQKQLHHSVQNAEMTDRDRCWAQLLRVIVTSPMHAFEAYCTHTASTSTDDTMCSVISELKNIIALNQLKGNDSAH